MRFLDWETCGYCDTPVLLFQSADEEHDSIHNSCEEALSQENVDCADNWERYA